MAQLETALQAEGLLTAAQVDDARQLAQASGRSFFDVLIKEGFVDERVVLEHLASDGGIAFVVLRDLQIPEAAVRVVSAKLAAHYAIMPVRFEQGVLTVATSEPFNLSAVNDLQTRLGYHVERVLACRADIHEALRRYYGVGADTVERILAETPARGEETPRNTAETAHDLERMAEDVSVVRLVNQIFQEAIQDRATDIHFEVYRDEMILRRRIDGILYDMQIPRNIRLLYPAIVSRVKLMAGLNIVERRLPQDGRSRVKIGPREYDLRVSVVPAMHGEDIVIRILPSTMGFALEQIGFSEAHLVALRELIAKPHGIIFATGPTGSGKSTTLYACLTRLNTRERKIITIEDPVEYEVKGVTQTQIRPEIGLTFSRALRSMLRHDPDVMMVGEVRDRETAEIAIQTAMTGHLVLSTLHTNDAAGGAVRLIDMGIDPYLITSTVLAFLAQRLVRIICPSCRESYMEGEQRLYRGRGCQKCGLTGYHGRMAIGEFLPLTPDIQQLILQKSSAKDIRIRANELGMTTLAADGLEKVLKGLTTAEEVLRVTSL
jgi:type II secretory ATPase GspE/PulE/Tfp pilus assembly ATPase PilB-like protein